MSARKNVKKSWKKVHRFTIVYVIITHVAESEERATFPVWECGSLCFLGGDMLRIVVIGAGIVGSLIARELTKYDVEVILIEKELDVGWGVTKANSAIVHAGYDDPPGSVRARFCAMGNKMYTELSEELDFELKRIGSLVVVFNDEEIRVLEELLKQGEKNGVPNLKILDKDETLDKEPGLSYSVKASLWAPTAGITEPWMVAIAAVENALDNGLKLHLDEKVIDIVVEKSRVKKVVTERGEYEADVIVNCAGLFADEIAKMAGAEYTPIYPRKGEYILLDKNAGNLVKRIIFPTPTDISKGILVLPTVDGGILLGPTAMDLSRDRKRDLATTREGLKEVVEKTKKMVPGIDLSYAIKTFAGLRPESPQRDFFIKASERIWGFINVMAMRSPGLTAAPAIAKYVVEKIIQEDLKINLQKKEDFNPYRKGIIRFAELPLDEWDEWIKKDPLAGKIVCYCNRVTEREIVEAIKRGARTLDGIKFRTRAMFGRCQGGFCMTRILKILARELGVDESEILLKSRKSWLIDGRVRE